MGINDRIIDVLASDAEWELLFKWILDRTPVVERKIQHNPWIKRETPPEETKDYLETIMEAFGTYI